MTTGGLPRKRKRGKNPCAVTKEDAVSGTAAAAATYPRRNSATATARMVAAACARRTAIAATGKTAAAGAAAAGAAIATIAAATTAKAAAAAASRTGAAGRRASAANCTTARAAILAARCSAACSAEKHRVPRQAERGYIDYVPNARTVKSSRIRQSTAGAILSAFLFPAHTKSRVVFARLFRIFLVLLRPTDSLHDSSAAVPSFAGDIVLTCSCLAFFCLLFFLRQAVRPTVPPLFPALPGISH